MAATTTVPTNGMPFKLKEEELQVLVAFLYMTKLLEDDANAPLSASDDKPSTTTATSNPTPYTPLRNCPATLLRSVHSAVNTMCMNLGVDRHHVNNIPSHCWYPIFYIFHRINLDLYHDLCKVLKLVPTTTVTREALKPGVMEAKRLISANCGKEDPDELFQKANEELLKLVLAILHDEFFRDEAGEDIQIGDVTVKSFDINNKFL
jgi:hypothetical protein